MDAQSEEAQVKVERFGSLGRITLDRPKALNSLTLGMVRDIDAALDRFENDPNVAAVMIDGAGERGLCAGGDIRLIYESGRQDPDLATTFWREEYRLNAGIDRFPKPYVAIMDGITMGGGVGVSAHGSHRIATERLRLAMPETGIGFFPDVGATWLLSRAPGEIGTYLGLTGAIIGASDAIYAGLADRLVPYDRLPPLRDALSDLRGDNDSDAVDRVIAGLAVEPPPSRLRANRASIDRLFRFDTVEEIVASLASEKGEFASETLATLRSRSPTSLKVTLRLLRVARESVTLEECLSREFAACGAVLRSLDFYEGVRAAVIDKDRKPVWKPGSLDQVSAAIVEAYFPTDTELLFPSTTRRNEDV